MIDYRGHEGKYAIVTFPLHVPLFGFRDEIHIGLGLDVVLERVENDSGSVQFYWDRRHDSSKINSALNTFLERRLGSCVVFRGSPRHAAVS